MYLNNQCETLLGVTGSGKAFTMANIIQQLNKPTLIIVHNKTLAAQLYGEFKKFFPNNAVEYFVSYCVGAGKWVIFSAFLSRFCGRNDTKRTGWYQTDKMILWLFAGTFLNDKNLLNLKVKNIKNIYSVLLGSRVSDIYYCHRKKCCQLFENFE